MYLFRSHTQTNWIIVSTIPVPIIFSPVNRLLIEMILICLSLLAVVETVSILFTNTMLIKPIRQVNQIAGALSNMDFTVDVKKFRTDEIGEIQRALIQIRDSLRRGIDNIHQEHLSKTIESGKRLNTVVVESFDAMELIAKNTNMMDTKAKIQMESVVVASDSAVDIFKHTDSFEQTMHSQVDSIAKSSVAIEQVVANIDSIRSVVGNVSKN